MLLGKDSQVIGCLKSGRAKLIVRGEETRCLDKPAQDEWERYLSEKGNNAKTL